MPRFLVHRGFDLGEYRPVIRQHLAQLALRLSDCRWQVIDLQCHRVVSCRPELVL
ncbi:hypothetical protein [Trinickia terrae]|uniref:hypothetical protein n=1 Tax=Trinickia terrae TaxID=2571161 RepID=UPI001F0E988C|nr:hypothetical protein [Trinickia terrae]